VEAAKVALRQQMSLAELRQARKLTQDALGQTKQVGQPAIAKLEKRTDMYVGNLRRFVEAMGGELEIVARFTDGDVTINNFVELAV
jgi:predicted transcriptional regulator